MRRITNIIIIYNFDRKDFTIRRRSNCRRIFGYTSNRVSKKIQTKQSGRASEPQKVVMYLALETLKLRYQEVIPLCGNWTTKTIRASNNWVKNELISNTEFSKKISRIKSIISPKLSYKLN